MLKINETTFELHESDCEQPFLSVINKKFDRMSCQNIVKEDKTNYIKIMFVYINFYAYKNIFFILILSNNINIIFFFNV